MSVREKIAQSLDRAITWILYGLILLLPLLIGRGFYALARPPRVTALKLAAALLLLLWVTSCALAGRLKWRRTPWTYRWQACWPWWSSPPPSP